MSDTLRAGPVRGTRADSACDNQSKPQEQSSETGITERRSSLHVMDTVVEVANEELVCVEAATYQRQQCPPRCRCQCHATKTKYQSPSWLQPLLGSFFLQYDSLPMLAGRDKCDVQQCRNSSSTIRLNYFFPVRVLNRAILLSTSISSSLGGVGASLHLKVPRIIEDTHAIWFAVEYSSLTRFQQLFSQTSYSPVDYTKSGLTLLSVSRRDRLIVPSRARRFAYRMCVMCSRKQLSGSNMTWSTFS